MDTVSNKGAWSEKEALSRVADPNWVTLDSFLTSTDFPNLQEVHLALDQNVNLFIQDFDLDAYGTPCSVTTRLALQEKVADSLYHFFPRLKASTIVDLTIEAIVNVRRQYPS